MTEFKHAGKLPPRKPRFSKQAVKDKLHEFVLDVREKYGNEYAELIIELAEKPDSELVSDCQ